MTQVESFQLGMTQEAHETNLTLVRYFKIKKIFSEYQRATILDAGCGPGIILQECATHNTVYGVDLNELALSAPYKQVFLKTLGVDRLPFSDNFFDAIHCGETVEHVMNGKQMLSEFYRVLKPYGLLYISTVNVRTLQSILLMLFCNEPSPGAARYDTYHCRDYTTKLLRQELESVKFKVTKTIGTSFWFWLPWKGRFECAAALATHLPSWSSGFIMSATK